MQLLIIGKEDVLYSEYHSTWLPIKSHADWEHHIFRSEKTHVFCGGYFAYRTPLTDCF